MTQTITAQYKINKYCEYKIDNETASDMRNNSCALTEMFSGLYEQKILVEIYALERREHDLDKITDVITADTLTFLIDISETHDHVYDVTEAFITQDRFSLRIDDVETVRKMIMDLAQTITY